MAERLVAVMDVAHQAGLILRDFNPNNVMVLPDGQLRLVDLELAVAVGQENEALTRTGTPGYGAAEQLAGASPAFEADYYSLGATICFVVIGSIPYFLKDMPEVRPLRERLAQWLAVRGEALDIPAAVQMLILRLMDDEPERRWTTSEAKNALTEASSKSWAGWPVRCPHVEARTPARQPPQTSSLPGNGLDSDNGRLGEEQWQQTVDGIVGYLLSSMNPAGGEQLWPASCARGVPDPCAVHLGAAGVVGVLTRAFELTGDPRLPEAIATAGRWIVQRLPADANRPPGLYFGKAGIAWSLYEAGRGINDDQLAEQGLALA